MSADLAARLAAARRERRGLEAVDAPANHAEAVAVSTATMRLLGATPGGWKVGAAPGGEPVAAPLYASALLTSGATCAHMGRPIIPEAEIGLRLARDLPPHEAPYTRDAILAATAEIIVGLELIERRVPGDAPFWLQLADDLGNLRYVVGDRIAPTPGVDLTRLRCRLWVDGALVSDREGGHARIDPLLPLLDWANAPRAPASLRTGDIVTLGSLTPLIVCEKAAHLVAEIEGIGRVEARLV